MRATVARHACMWHMLRHTRKLVLNQGNGKDSSRSSSIALTFQRDLLLLCSFVCLNGAAHHPWSYGERERCKWIVKDLAKTFGLQFEMHANIMWKSISAVSTSSCCHLTTILVLIARLLPVQIGDSFWLSARFVNWIFGGWNSQNSHIDIEQYKIFETILGTFRDLKITIVVITNGIYLSFYACFFKSLVKGTSSRDLRYWTPVLSST